MLIVVKRIMSCKLDYEAEGVVRGLGLALSSMRRLLTQVMIKTVGFPSVALGLSWGKVWDILRLVEDLLPIFLPSGRRARSHKLVDECQSLQSIVVEYPDDCQ